MSTIQPIEVFPIGVVESALTELESAPRQRALGAPEAWLVVDVEIAAGLADLAEGDEIIVLTWLDRARRDVLSVHPQGDPDQPRRGVFGTRSPHRPNPIGLHRVQIITVDDNRVLVDDLEAVDGTPVLDIKPVLDARDG